VGKGRRRGWGGECGGIKSVGCKGKIIVCRKEGGWPGSRGKGERASSMDRIGWEGIQGSGGVEWRGSRGRQIRRCVRVCVRQGING
jgi:hypothetical protein